MSIQVVETFDSSLVFVLVLQLEPLVVVTKALVFIDLRFFSLWFRDYNFLNHITNSGLELENITCDYEINTINTRILTTCSVMGNLKFITKGSGTSFLIKIAYLTKKVFCFVVLLGADKKFC